MDNTLRGTLDNVTMKVKYLTLNIFRSIKESSEGFKIESFKLCFLRNIMCSPRTVINYVSLSTIIDIDPVYLIKLFREKII